MRYTAFYVIRGNKDLDARVRSAAYEKFDFLLGPFLWANEQGGQMAYTLDDYTAGVKRAFLADLRCISLDEGVIERVLDGFRVGEDVFDRWWNIEAFRGLDGSVSDVIGELRRAGRIDVLDQIGMPIVGVVGGVCG